MLSLRSWLNDGKPKAAQGATSSRKAKIREKPLIDLNNDDDDDETDDGVAMVPQEKLALENLDKTLTKCARCGPDKYCKIDKSGEHTPLSFPQRRGWALALVGFL